MNKILVLVYVPLFEQEYDIVIPINQKIGIIKHYIISVINELMGSNYLKDNCMLYDKDTCHTFDNDAYVSESSIIEGTKLILI